MCKEHTAFYSAGAYDDPRTMLIIGDAYAGLEARPPLTLTSPPLSHQLVWQPPLCTYLL